jgi:four helix bundle suffix protein
MPAKLKFGGTFGHFYLTSWILAEIVHLATRRCCQTFLSRQNDPCGRQYDQMTQAARSAPANIAEGSARHATSRETEMRLTDVARATTLELQGDYLDWLLFKGEAPWPKDSPEACEVRALRIDEAAYGDDVVRDAALHVLAQRKKFARWLDSPDDTAAANALLILCGRVIALLTRQLESQGEEFTETGGFTEKLSEARLEARDAKQQADGAPACPECGKPMRQMIARKGRNAGNPFWSCTAYPECKGTRSVS